MGWTNFGIVVSLAAVSVITAIYLAKKWSLQHQRNETTCGGWTVACKMAVRRRHCCGVRAFYGCIRCNWHIMKRFEKSRQLCGHQPNVKWKCWTLSSPIAHNAEYFLLGQLMKERRGFHCLQALSRFFIISQFQWFSGLMVKLLPSCTVSMVEISVEEILALASTNTIGCMSVIPALQVNII